tara:strand:- start:14528 stop:15469 length:942 start_codon:yes stop_codon:yes gene_type:complete
LNYLIPEELKKLSGFNFLSISDLNFQEISSLIDLASKIKNNLIEFNTSKKVLGLIFDKASTRTRVSFQVAMYRLGGTTIDINPLTSQIGRGEPIKDTVRVLSNYVDALAIRTYKQQTLEEYVRWGSIPVVNALTDMEHPCQILADFLTIKEEFGSFDDVVITYIGDGNNVANSLLLCGSIMGVQVKIGCPDRFRPNPLIIKKADNLSPQSKKPFITNDPNKAVDGANVIYTDVWASMGQEDESAKRDKIFEGFCVNKKLLSRAKGDAIVLHCLPAYREKEISDETFECDSSRVFSQAENRLHAQQALLACLLS